MNGYVLGVDGGGTKTHCAVFDMEGNKIDFINWGPTNYEGLEGGFAGLKLELDKLLLFVLKKNGIRKSDLKRCVFGLSGVDTKRQHGIISGIIKDIGISDFILCNDAFPGIKAGSDNGYGICAINGTGCSVAGIDTEGDMLQIGGMGDITGDAGGSGYLGKCAVSGVYNSLFKDNIHTVMTDLIFDMLDVNSKFDFIEALNQTIGEGIFQLQDFNRIVFLAANEGDVQALDILDNMGKEYARSINSIINSMNFEKADNLDIILAGSVFVKGENPTAINRIKQDLLENKKLKFNFRLLQYPPVAGAVIWALEELHNRKIISSRILGQFEKCTTTAL